jgi:hypothetical protein
MPRLPIDYSSVSFYKLCCKDISITDIYIGHTTNFTARKNQHKHECHTESRKIHYNLNVYKFIRENGGFDNWDMIELSNRPCENNQEARRIEREYMEQLGATLNSRRPILTKEEHLEQTHIWMDSHREDVNKKSKQYYHDNIELITEQRKKYREENRERLRLVSKKYRDEHREELNAKRRKNNKI